MNKTHMLFLFCLLTMTFSFGQNKVKISLAKELTVSEANKIELYKFNPNKQCDQSKAVSVIYGNKISTCFDYLRTIKSENAKKIIGLLRMPNTYGNADVACFDTDYALLIFNKSNDLIGYVNISLSCNKLLSTPVITERDHYSKGGLRKPGFSKKGESELLKLLDIKKLSS